MGNPNTTRRAFLKVGALTGLGVLGAGVAAGCAPSPDGARASSSVYEEVEWDGEYDVVVIGFGAAGAASAISAAEQGAGVLLVDKAPEGSEGGNSRFSSQLFVTSDDKAQALDYYRSLRGEFYAPDDVLGAYAEGLCGLREMLVAWGLDDGELLDVTDTDIEAFIASL